MSPFPLKPRKQREKEKRGHRSVKSNTMPDLRNNNPHSSRSPERKGKRTSSAASKRKRKETNPVPIFFLGKETYVLFSQEGGRGGKETDSCSRSPERTIITSFLSKL